MAGQGVRVFLAGLKEMQKVMLGLEFPRRTAGSHLEGLGPWWDKGDWVGLGLTKTHSQIPSACLFS